MMVVLLGVMTGLLLALASLAPLVGLVLAAGGENVLGGNESWAGFGLA